MNPEIKSFTIEGFSNGDMCPAKGIDENSEFLIFSASFRI